jgi:TPR repeat protein
MRKMGDRRTALPASSRRAPGPMILLVIALLAFGAIGPSLAARAAAQDPDVRQGISAFNAGAFDTALQKLEPLAKAGNPEAAYWTGRMYEDGLGVKKDVDKAIDYYTQSAEKGWQNAKLRLGEIYFHGTEVLQDFAKAHKWLERAAFDGISLAQRDLGTLYANGWGTQKDPVWAYVWYEFAARQGDYEAQKMRDSLLRAMTADQVAEGQRLTQKIAPEVFGLVKGKPGETPAHAGKSETAPTTPAEHTS